MFDTHSGAGADAHAAVTGDFLAPIRATTGSSPRTIAVADFDRDAKALAVANANDGPSDATGVVLNARLDPGLRRLPSRPAEAAAAETPP